MNNMPAMTGWTWLKEGTGLFRKQPAALTTLLFANILFSILIGSVPLLGAVLAPVLLPCYSLAFMEACRMIDDGERVTPLVLMTGFRKPILMQLCKIGLIYLVVSMLLVALTHLLVDIEQFRQVLKPTDPKNVPTIDGGEFVKMFALSCLNASVLIVLSFSAPLLYWKGMKPGKALFYSFFAVFKSARVFLVMLLCWFGMLLVATAVIRIIMGNSMFGLVLVMWLLFLFVLLLQCALYAGYRHIFGKPAGVAAGRVNLEK
jgi:hypothetical protein